MEAANKGRILLVEDDIIVQKVHCTILKKMGYSVDVAANNQQALAKYQADTYAVLVLDGNLPDGTGFELAKLIRSKENFGKHQPIILVSAMSMEEMETKCQEANIDGFLQKPVNFGEFECLISNLINRNLIANHSQFNPIHNYI